MKEKKASILIVDDDRLNLTILADILKVDYVIYKAKTGAEALKRAKEDQPDLILLDIVMPDMSGYDVLIDLKESDETRSIPVIFITSLTNVKDEEKGFLLGAVDYITKPFNNSIVKARVKNQLKIVKYIKKIEQLGMIDAVTEIPNRRSFDTEIIKAWSNAQDDNKPIALLAIDVDNFKEYNDTYGHPQGDLMLHAVASVLEKCAKERNGFAARTGGEEFSVILYDADLDKAIEVSEQILATIRKISIPTQDRLQITSGTVSLGISTLVPKAEDDFMEFIKQADDMLYRAKQSGRDQVCFDRADMVG